MRGVFVVVGFRWFVVAGAEGVQFGMLLLMEGMFFLGCSGGEVGAVGALVDDCG